MDILAPLAIHIIGFLMVPLRLFARWSMMHGFAPDDWIMLFTGVRQRMATKGHQNLTFYRCFSPSSSYSDSLVSPLVLPTVVVL